VLGEKFIPSTFGRLSEHAVEGSPGAVPSAAEVRRSEKRSHLQECRWLFFVRKKKRYGKDFAWHYTKPIKNGSLT
jgi:hypothetical protein